MLAFQNPSNGILEICFEDPPKLCAYGISHISLLIFRSLRVHIEWKSPAFQGRVSAVLQCIEIHYRNSRHQIFLPLELLFEKYPPQRIPVDCRKTETG